MKLTVLIPIFLGEFSVIYAEQLGAKLYGLLSYSFTHAFYLTLIPLFIGSICLVAGYMLGLKHFQNIWAITAISFGSILIVEPLFNYFYIGQLPTLGSGIGVGLAILGILAVLFIR